MKGKVKVQAVMMMMMMGNRYKGNKSFVLISNIDYM